MCIQECGSHLDLGSAVSLHENMEKGYFLKMPLKFYYLV